MPPTEGHTAKFVGRAGAEFDVETGRQAARLAALNGLAVARRYLGSRDRITRQNHTHRLPRRAFGHNGRLLRGQKPEPHQRCRQSAFRHARRARADFRSGLIKLHFGVAQKREPRS